MSATDEKMATKHTRGHEKRNRVCRIMDSKIIFDWVGRVSSAVAEGYGGQAERAAGKSRVLSADIRRWKWKCVGRGPRPRRIEGKDFEPLIHTNEH